MQSKGLSKVFSNTIYMYTYIHLHICKNLRFDLWVGKIPILAWRIPWTEEPGGLQSIVLHDMTEVS